MRGVLDFKFDNIKEGNQIECSQFTLDNGATWQPIEEIMSVIENWETPIMFVRHLSFMLQILQPIIHKSGYQPKYCKDNGRGWHPWPKKLKEKEYEPRMYGKNRRCYFVKFPNVKMYDADKWIYSYRNPLDLLSEEEYNCLMELSENGELKSTPTSEAWKDTVLPDSSIRDDDIYRNITSGIQGGIIELYAQPLKKIKKAYHYDITSMYPYIVSSLDYLPYGGLIQELTADEQTDHNKYAYWILDEENEWRCNVEADIAPAGSYKAPLKLKNPYKKKMLDLYEEKSKYPKNSAYYQLAKLKVNGAIGRIIKRPSCSIFYPFVNSNQDMIKPKPYSVDAMKQRHVCEYTYIIAKARQFIKNHMNAARKQGAKILQVNTDGFFTNKPIAADETRFLGSLREEYVAHNLTFFACNQYACDEEICIAGLPKIFYKPNKLQYEWFNIEYDVNKGTYIYNVRRLTLGGQ